MSLLSDRLKYAREKKNLKQIQVKQITGINNKTLSGYENGVSEPDGDTLKILATLYEVSIDWLLGKQEKENAYALPEEVISKVIKEAEAEFKVSLRDDPLVESAVRDLIHNLARMKKGNQKKD